MNSTEAREEDSLGNEATTIADDQETSETLESVPADPNLITITDDSVVTTTFADIIPEGELRKAVDALGFTKPTPVQALALPAGFSGRDVIVQAQTGSGKTMVYVLPMLAALKEAQKNGSASDTFGLVLAPTRELALQVVSVINSVDPSAQPVCLIGGTDMGGQKDGLRENSSIVVGTPGRVLDFLKQKAFRLNRCRYFVLDEADEMLSIGFLEDVRAILSRLPDKRQGLFVTATLTPRVDMLANSFLSDPLTLITPKADLPPVTHLYCEVGSDLMSKPLALCDIIETQRPNSAIIFCNTKSDTHLVEVLLRRRGFDARRINSELSQRQRNAVMNKLRRKELRFLVATDIAARGIDISQIDLVINYSIHEQPETYVHRTGRTGRAGRAGTAISLVGARDFGAFHFLTKVTKFDFQRITLPTEDDVASARLAHLYEIIRQASFDERKADGLIAQKLLSELGGVNEPTEELAAMVGKLCRYALEHHVAQEAASLDEEKEAEAPQQHEGEGKRRDRDRGRDRDRRRGRDRDDNRDENRREGRDTGEREQGEERQRAEGEEGGHRHHDRRDNDRRDNRNEGRERHDRRGREHHDSREQSASNNEPGADEREVTHSHSHHQVREPDEIRLYIGQGTAHGMTPQLFRDLALEMAELAPADLLQISFRDHYGFVDLQEPQAERLINSLNGIEYNGVTLPVEFATRLSQQRSGGGDRRGDRHRGRDDRRGGGRHHDRRGGGRGGRGGDRRGGGGGGGRGRGRR